ncbi:MAG: hypothetical protein M1152_04520 [Actinobacteria bacterium]|nr:hypothetical protein [Actinomycetota bacterium]
MTHHLRFKIAVVVLVLVLAGLGVYVGIGKTIQTNKQTKSTTHTTSTTAKHFPTTSTSTTTVSTSSPPTILQTGGKSKSALLWSGPQQTQIDFSYSDNISCVSATFCMAVSGQGNEYGQTFNGTSWSAPRSVLWNSIVSCASATFCVAVGEDGYFTTFNGTSWSAPQLFVPTSLLKGYAWAEDHLSYPAFDSISCVSTSFCVVGDGGGDVYTFNGTSWSAPLEIGSPYSPLMGMSCVSTSFCVAVDGGGNAIIFNGTSWSAPQLIDPTYSYAASLDQPTGYSLTSVSCTSTTFCIATDGSNTVRIFNGTAWFTSVVPPAGPPTAGYNSVSCISRSFCEAVGVEGYATTFNGTSWSAPQLIDPVSHKKDASPFSFTSVSCVPATESPGELCVAGDGGWNAFIARS